MEKKDSMVTEEKENDLHRVQKLFFEPRIARILYNLLLTVTGIILLTILSKDGFPVEKTIKAMLAWFLLVVIFPVPDLAKSNIEPFKDNIDDLLSNE